MNKCFCIALFLLSISFISCEDSDDNCEKGELNLVYDWKGAKSIQTNEYLIATPSKGNPTTIVTDNIGTSLSLPTGTYRFFAYEAVPSVTTDGSKFELKSDANGVITPPEPFSAGIIASKIEHGANGKIILPMFYQTRELIVRVNFNGEGLTELVSVNGTIDNVTLSRNVDEGFPPHDRKPRHVALSNGTVVYNFVSKDVDEPDLLEFAGRARLLGIDGGESQTLFIKMIFENGELTRTLDITSALEKFHIELVEEPFVIELLIGISEDFEATIEDWKFGSMSIIGVQ